MDPPFCRELRAVPCGIAVVEEHIVVNALEQKGGEKDDKSEAKQGKGAAEGNAQEALVQVVLVDEGKKLQKLIKKNKNEIIVQWWI